MGLLKIFPEVLDQQQVDRKFDMQTKETSGAQENRKDKTSTSNAAATNNCINMPDYFRASTNREAEKYASRTLTLKIQNFSYNFTDTGCFKCTFRLQVREGSHLYQTPPRREAYVL